MLFQLLLLFALTSVLLPACVLLLVRLFGKQTGHRVCYLILIVCAIRILIPTGWGLPTLWQLPQERVAVTLTDTPSASDAPVVAAPAVSPSASVPVSDGDETAVREPWSFRRGWALLRANAEAAVITVWLLGAAITLGLTLLPQLISQRRLLRQAKRVEEPLQRQYEALCDTLKIHHPPQLLQHPDVVSPCLCSVLRPVILVGALPEDSSRASLILHHELVHYKRRDVLINWLLLLDLAVFWWNPLVHLFVRCVQTERELSCDECVTRTLSEEERCLYGEVLLEALRQSKTARALHVVSFAHRKTALRRRFEALLSPTKKRGGALLLAVSLAVLLLSAFLLGCSASAPETDAAEPADGAAPIIEVVGQTDLSQEQLRSLVEKRNQPHKAGYLPVGWRVISRENEGGGYSLTFEPLYRAISYRMTLCAGGSDIGNTVRQMTCTDTLPTPVRQGFTFGGWYADEALTKPISEVPLADSTLYARWQEETTPSDFRFEARENGLVLTAYLGKASHVVVPAYVGGVPVCAIDVAAFAFCTELVSLTLPETVTHVGAGALRYCYRLQTLTLRRMPSSLDKSVFEACYGLTDIYFAGSTEQWRMATSWQADGVRLHPTT